MRKMNLSKMMLIAVLVAATSTACKKEMPAAEQSPVKVDGFWKGNVHQFSCAILNKPGGYSRFYFQMPGGDSSLSTDKLDGNYTMEGNKFIATYRLNGSTAKWLFESETISAVKMTGAAITYGGNLLPFDFKKQP